MKFAVITCYLQNYADMAAETVAKNKVEYCNRHGYDLFESKTVSDKYNNPLTHGNGISWQRLSDMHGILSSGLYEWAWCVGCDTLVTNMCIDLESIVDGNNHVVIAPDFCAIVQADSFLVRSSPEGLGYLSNILGLYDKYKTHMWVENAAMIETFDQFKSIIRHVPQRTLNAYDYALYIPGYTTSSIDRLGNDGQWKEGDLLIHWPGLPYDVRMREIHRRMAQVIR